MTLLAINFTWRRRNWRHFAGMALLALAGIAAIVASWAYFQLHAQEQRWQSDWQRLTGLAAERHDTGTPEQQERLKAELRFADGVIDQLDTPWDALFGAVEGAYSEQTILLGVEPDTERHEVRLTAEAKDLAAMLAYLSQVRQSPALKDAYLASHQINQQDPQKPVRFTIDAQWVEVPPSATDTPMVATITASAVAPKVVTASDAATLFAPEAKP